MKAEAGVEQFLDGHPDDEADFSNVVPFVDVLRQRIDQVKGNDADFKEYVNEQKKRKRRTVKVDSDLTDFLVDEKVLSECNFWHCSVPQQVTEDIRSEVFFDIPEERYNHKLAGNIKQEYVLKECRESVKDFVVATAWAYKKKPTVLNDLWVNYQAAGSLIPHTHMVEI